MSLGVSTGLDRITTTIDIRDSALTFKADVRWTVAKAVSLHLAASDWDAQGTDEVIVEGFTASGHCAVGYYALVTKYGAKIAEEIMDKIEENYRDGNFQHA